MPRGRKPTPTHLRIIQGNPGKRKLPHREPSRPKRLHPTRKLSPEQKKIWSRVIKHAPYGLLQPIDAELLTMYVAAADLYNQASENLATGPLIIRTPKGYPIVSPWLGILNRQQTIMQSIAAELGFTPTSRARLGVQDDMKPEDEDEKRFFDDY